MPLTGSSPFPGCLSSSLLNHLPADRLLNCGIQGRNASVRPGGCRTTLPLCLTWQALRWHLWGLSDLLVSLFPLLSSFSCLEDPPSLPHPIPVPTRVNFHTVNLTMPSLASNFSNGSPGDTVMSALRWREKNLCRKKEKETRVPSQ